MVASHGSRARAEHTHGACWETQDIGIGTAQARRINCVRMVNVTVFHHVDWARTSPADFQKHKVSAAVMACQTRSNFQFVRVRKSVSTDSNAKHSTEIRLPLQSTWKKNYAIPLAWESFCAGKYLFFRLLTFHHAFQPPEFCSKQRNVPSKI